MQPDEMIADPTTPEMWMERIRKVLSPDLLKSQYRAQNAGNPMFGHCYVASEALYHLLGGPTSGYVPRHGRDANGIVHWWLADKQTGDILDPTEAQYTSQGDVPPYDRAMGGGFLTREPSRRAQEVISRVRV